MTYSPMSDEEIQRIEDEIIRVQVVPHLYDVGDDIQKLVDEVRRLKEEVAGLETDLVAADAEAEAAFFDGYNRC